MHDEDQTYTPLSAEPLDMAQRLRGYIEGLVSTADRDKEDPHWLITQARKTYAHLPEHEAVETHRKKLNLRPHMQRRIIQATLQHVLRLEYHLRCFILFLTAQIIELGRAGEPPEPREPPQPRDFAYARKVDQEIRDAQRDLPRINSFKVLTPVFEGKGRRRRRRGPRPYLMLPDSLKVVDAGHVFARIRRLEHVLANADKFAMSLAKRAVIQVPELSEKKSPLQGGDGQRGEKGLHEMQSSRAGGEVGASALEQSTQNPPLSQPTIPVQTGIHASELTSRKLPDLRHGSQIRSGIGGEGSGHSLPLIPAHAGISEGMTDPDSRLRGNERDTLILHPLYFAPLANFCPPAEHYDSAPDTRQKRDFNFTHFLASSRLEQIGLGVRPDPYRGLPDLSCLDPPPPPRISSL